jgi:phospholipid N-methyltransferase
MRRALDDYRAFFREFRREYHTTGAVAPSGRWLARALSRYVRAAGSPKRILEVGPGTGAVTRQILPHVSAADRFDLVELNGRFVELLRARFESDPLYRAAAAQSRVIHASLEDLPRDQPYDLIVSGLPLNNFAAADVARLLEVMGQLLAQGGTLSFFEYIAIRAARGLVSGPAERARLRAIGETLRRVLSRHEIRRDWVWPNLPPAWVHHVRFERNGGPQGNSSSKAAGG